MFNIFLNIHNKCNVHCFNWFHHFTDIPISLMKATVWTEVYTEFNINVFIPSRKILKEIKIYVKNIL